MMLITVRKDKFSAAARTCSVTRYCSPGQIVDCSILFARSTRTTAGGQHCPKMTMPPQLTTTNGGMFTLKLSSQSRLIYINISNAQNMSKILQYT